MPTYDYACTACDNRFEIQQAFTDDALTKCEKCDGKLRKVFNSVGVVFKGSGFYRNDSRNSSTVGAAKKTSDAGEKTGEKSNEKTAAKSESAASVKTGTSSSTTKSEPAKAKPATAAS